MVYNVSEVDGFFLNLLCLKRSPLCPLGFVNAGPLFGPVLDSSQRKHKEENKQENNESGTEDDDYDDYTDDFLYDN